MNGFLVLAADGSDINIPTIPETIATYGNTSNNNTKLCAQIGLGCLYDALNRMILDATINAPKFNEMAIAEAQIAKVRETIGDKPFLVTMDRGYAAIPAFLRMIDSKIYFVARLKSSDFKAEQKALSSDDENVLIQLTKIRQQHYKGTADEELVTSRDSFNLRISII